jgi:hypothetical protein
MTIGITLEIISLGTKLLSLSGLTAMPNHLNIYTASNSEPNKITVNVTQAPFELKILTISHFAKKAGNGGSPAKANTKTPKANSNNGFFLRVFQLFSVSAPTKPDNQKSPALAKKLVR